MIQFNTKKILKIHQSQKPSEGIKGTQNQLIFTSTFRFRLSEF